MLCLHSVIENSGAVAQQRDRNAHKFQPYRADAVDATVYKRTYRPRGVHNRLSSASQSDVHKRQPELAPINGNLPEEVDFMLDDEEMFDKSKRFEEYGHMRFGKRAGGEESDDYGHMRFGKRGEQLKWYRRDFNFNMIYKM